MCLFIHTQQTAYPLSNYRNWTFKETLLSSASNTKDNDQEIGLQDINKSTCVKGYTSFQ